MDTLLENMQRGIPSGGMTDDEYLLGPQKRWPWWEGVRGGVPSGVNIYGEPEYPVLGQEPLNPDFHDGWSPEYITFLNETGAHDETGRPDPCWECEGRGIVFGPYGTELCPECGGSKQAPQFYPKLWSPGGPREGQPMPTNPRSWPDIKGGVPYGWGDPLV